MRRAALLLVLLAAAGCGPGTKSQGTPGADPSHGRRLIVQYGCGACHRIGGVSGADGRVGPALTQVPGLQSIVGVLPNTPANLARFVENAPRYVPDGAMPDLGVTAAEAKDIAAYLEHGQ